MTDVTAQAFRQAAAQAQRFDYPYWANVLLAAAEQREQAEKCPLATRCRTHGYYHGAEAEELREGIEAAIKAAVGLGKNSVPVSSLRTLLDETDARDSLAYLEVKDREE